MQTRIYSATFASKEGRYDILEKLSKDKSFEVRAEVAKSVIRLKDLFKEPISQDDFERYYIYDI